VKLSPSDVGAMGEVQVVELKAREMFACHTRGLWAVGEITLCQR